ncbi:MAG TPA: cytochrome c nitrite reductase small subunit [Candidatus Hydrogenedentes bacterium]|mgnify:CR=1 FL=1|nr:cytochrome c nitrite reductase small subunit [Candidatus Hydrogenedentota bacterium]HOS03045.1 cytochrome c nitrite reductase small subunit [Candidatus Hydrogenedentota bacterium]
MMRGIAAVLAGLLSGALSGVGAYTFLYARGASYLTDNPAACANCHVMNDNYNAWERSSHRAVAVCNDCHTPHDFIGKYATKALNGYHHSMAFTLGGFHEPIAITPRNRAIAEAACRRCHGDIVQAIDRVHAGQNMTSCIRCHPSVGHLE